MFRRDVFRAGRWHTVDSLFHITDTPHVIAYDRNYITVTWTMSEVSSGQIEYGLTTAYGSTTTEQDISGGYSTHTQTLTNLTPGTTYHYRSKSTAASGTTIYSDDQSFTTAGQPISTSIGPRYSFYGDSSPTFPALPGTYVVPTDEDIPSDGTDCSAEMAAYILAQANGTTIVLDKTEGGAGTVYTLESRVYLNMAASALKQNITIYGYNTKIEHHGVLTENNDFFLFGYGGFEGFTFQGLWLEGPNTLTGTWDCGRSIGTPKGHGWQVCMYKDLTIEDCKLTQIMGDAVQLTQNDPSLRYGGWYEPTNFIFRYNLVSGTGRQGVTLDQGNGVYIRNNIIEDTAYSSVNSEDPNEGTHGRFINVEVTDNILRRWSWWLTSAGVGYIAPCVAFILTTNDNIVETGNILIARNSIENGWMGFGNPEAEYEYSGQTTSYSGCMAIMGMNLYYELNRTLPKYDITIEDNSVALDPVFVGRSCNKGPGDYGEFVCVTTCDGLTITNNDCEDRPITHVQCTDVTISGNGSGTVYDL